MENGIRAVLHFKKILKRSFISLTSVPGNGKVLKNENKEEYPLSP
jgi:hypothetical protein